MRESQFRCIAGPGVRLRVEQNQEGTFIYLSTLRSQSLTAVQHQPPADGISHLILNYILLSISDDIEMALYEVLDEVDKLINVNKMFKTLA